MRIRHIALMALVLAAGCLLVSGNRSAAAQTGGMRSVNFDGVSFRYDASLASGVVPKLMPEFVVTGGSGVWLARPRHIEFDFTQFHGSSTLPVPSTIYIFPVRGDYRSLNPDDNHDHWLPAVQALGDLLSRHPDLRQAMEQGSTAPGSLPEMGSLPPINAATILVGKPGYLSFRNGLGIRYLVQGAQDVTPPDRDNTSYTFQGLTADGKFYVAAFFPAFPTTMEPIEVFQGSDVRAYYLNLIDRFDKISNDAYTPNLDLLDKMIGSLSVHPQSLDNVPGMPPTGAGTTGAQYAGELVIIALVLLGSGVAMLHRRRWRN